MVYEPGIVVRHGDRGFSIEFGNLHTVTAYPGSAVFHFLMMAREANETPVSVYLWNGQQHERQVP